MKVGDLVKLNVGNHMGIITTIINNFTVGVWWTNSDYIYMEPIVNLEVVNEAG